METKVDIAANIKKYNDKPFPCLFCIRGYARRSSLSEHYNRYHKMLVRKMEGYVEGGLHYSTHNPAIDIITEILMDRKLLRQNFQDDYYLNRFGLTEFNFRVNKCLQTLVQMCEPRYLVKFDEVFSIFASCHYWSCYTDFQNQYIKFPDDTCFLSLLYRVPPECVKKIGGQT